MTKFKIEDFKNSIHTGFIDKKSKSELLYQPELLVNRKNPRTKVLTSITSELERCESFFISVAFVTTGGVASLMNSLIYAEEKGIQGKVIVSQYLNFTQPEALRKLLKFKNIELRISTHGNSHSKGYLFKTIDYYNLIIGSSNLTDTALSKNKEWNLKVSALHSSDIVDKVIGEFESDFDNGELVTEKFIEKYSEIYNAQKLLNFKTSSVQTLEEIKPNSMQMEALYNLSNLRNRQETKALLISATGTGKTYLSAFDSKQFNPKRLLFVVHRQNIAKKAMKTFKSVFKNFKSMGLYSGNIKELDKDFLFSTVQTISKQSNLEQFDKNYFDYIVIDESHRSGANSYLRLIEYFNPKFLLGMTATPERTDGNDIFSLFNHNIAYEIRLNRAMEEEMLSPFHYYGVTDININGNALDDKSDFNLLTADERVDKIVTNANLYGTDNGVTRGLIFCSRKDEAQALSLKLNLKGLKTIALTGDNSEEERAEAIRKLESEDLNDKIEYILTVDIFNEGIDIPRVNQIIMMRPTNSSIIFIQQLGRGLRKTIGKSYVTIIDFIGNYTNNYLIPIALYGDTSYNKDSIRKLLSDGSRMIPGTSTINFDRISKEKIFKSIDNAKLKRFTDLRNDYDLLKFRLGREPFMMDFVEQSSRDPYWFVDYAKSYYNFAIKVNKELKGSISSKAVKLLELFSKEINNGKRITESILIHELIKFGSLQFEEFQKIIKTGYDFEIDEETIISTIANLNFEFVREKKDKKLISVREIYNLNIIDIKSGVISIAPEFSEMLEQQDFRQYFLDSVKYSIDTFNRNFKIEDWRNGFILYKKYSRKDVFRILNVNENPVPQNVGGYLVSPNDEHCPIFVNYHKEDNISESTKYEDEFVNNKEFNWMSKSNRKLESKDVLSILGKRDNKEIRLPLFIKKSNDESTEFYFMGDVMPIHDLVEQTTMKNDSGKDVPVVKIRFELKDSVPENIYRYITESNVSNNTSTSSEADNVKQITNYEENKSSIYQIPLYNFYAAAGSFSEMQSEKEYSMFETNEEYSDDYFACTVIGESMNRRIPNGSICLFKKPSAGSRDGKILLIENFDLQDADTNSAFTVKTYNSQKTVTEEGWAHKSIILSPNSYDDRFSNIVIDEDNGENMNIIGEFIKVL
ncbi:DUF3427 domain-containing protein [Dokdonia sp. 4H-3-7-5]|uniref:DUF3427 domain-containing protein n=1 Tax=Dokdonia sp. (strain 4H-3-7-5) TaxID=983548 RepID=UPI00020A718B|nr:DUF3427 domain-containing protein [Dokdonia sp. 4H-3-7-5]AEE20805.1 type III restriction protein res subunit [Dokdonia sp. 4H-3-7-5]